MQNVRGLARNAVVKTSVADGDKGTAQTIPLAKQLISEGMINPDVRRLAAAYCLPLQANDEPGELRAVFDGVLRDFRFIKDPVGMQLLQPAGGILETLSGNCASLNLILLPSLLGSIGYPTRAVTIKADPERPQEFSHVYIEAQMSDGQWVALDVARSNPQFGKSPERYWDRREWPLTGGASAGAYLNGYGRPNVTRGLGAPAILIVKARGFPRRGLGDDSDGGVDYGAIAASIPSVLAGVAQVVKAQNTPGQAFVGANVNYPATATGALGTGVAVTSTSSWLVVGALVVAGIWAFGRGR
jgi:hypothetical protein